MVGKTLFAFHNLLKDLSLLIYSKQKPPLATFSDLYITMKRDRMHESQMNNNGGDMLVIGMKVCRSLVEV